MHERKKSRIFHVRNLQIRSTSTSKRDGFQQNIACIGLVRWISATEKEEIFRNGGGGGANGKIGHVIFVDITESSIENPLNFH